jgi:carotenoid 1,2-hydratase
MRISERGAPLPRRVCGTITLTPEISTAFGVALDQTGRHWWQPIIPRGRVEVRLTHPDLRWIGTGYLDSNHGSTPLDEAMHEWTWLRTHTGGGGAEVIYDVTPTCGPPRMYGFQFGAGGATQLFEPPPRVVLPPSGWRIPRVAYGDARAAPRIIKTLEDAPFYNRTLLETTVGGERVSAVHETLSLTRFRSPWVRALLPFRMRRPLRIP